MSQTPKVVIVGRPNVGKSTLFNKLIGRRRALVHDEPGVTRDRLEENAEWWVKGKPYAVTMVDTGGLGGERFAEEIKAQVQMALEEASIVLFLFDSQAGLTPLDEELYRELQKSGIFRRIPALAVVNKVDAEVHEGRVADFFSLDFNQVLTISAEHSRGMDDLQAAVIEELGDKAQQAVEQAKEEDKNQDEFQAEFSEESSEDLEDDESSEKSEEDLEAEYAEVQDLDLEDEVELSVENKPARIPRIAIVGRPNVGKSTLTNALLGEKRMITSPIAGTTVDAVDSLVSLDGKPFIFVDTAGIRRKSKTEQGIEVLSVVQTRKALEKADVAILMIDAETGITDQDEKIAGLIEEMGRGVIIAINKWDIPQRTQPDFTRQMAADWVRKNIGFMRYAPIVFMSAIRGKGVDDLGSLIEEILHQRRMKISTHEFTEWIRKESTVHNPANAKFYLCHQTGRNPPSFICHVNDPEKIHFSLRRHLVNALRERWGFMGNPVRLIFIEAKGRRSLPKPVRIKQAGTKRSLEL